LRGAGRRPSSDGTSWIACRPGFFLPVRVLSRPFRKLFLQNLQDAFDAGALRFFGNLAGLAEPTAFAPGSTNSGGSNGSSMPSPRWPRTGTGLSRPLYPPRRHRQQPAGLALRRQVRFAWKDYRQDSKTKVMTLDADEFIRRFLLHALPDGFHRIRYYGFLAHATEHGRGSRRAS
jgi:hypothetical protein